MAGEEALLFLTGIPVIVMIAVMYMRHPDGVVTDSETGQSYAFDRTTGEYNTIVNFGRQQLELHGSDSVTVQELRDPSICAVCNTKIPDANHFCPGCGKKVK